MPISPASQPHPSARRRLLRSQLLCWLEMTPRSGFLRRPAPHQSLVLQCYLRGDSRSRLSAKIEAMGKHTVAERKMAAVVVLPHTKHRSTEKRKTTRSIALPTHTDATLICFQTGVFPVAKSKNWRCIRPMNREIAENCTLLNGQSFDPPQTEIHLSRSYEWLHGQSRDPKHNDQKQWQRVPPRG